MLARPQAPHSAPAPEPTFDPATIEDLIAACAPMVRALARRYSGLGVSLDDLEQEGAIGLMDAARRFDPRFGARFVTYARWWVRHRMQQFLRANRVVVTLPETRAVRLARRRLTQVTAALERESSAPASSHDVARALGIREEDVATARAGMSCCDVPLHLELEQRTDRYEPDRREASPEDIAAREELRRLARGLVRSLLRSLDERERLIIHERQLNEEPPSLRELGERLDISAERVRQLERRALSKMRLELEMTGQLGHARSCAFGYDA